MDTTFAMYSAIRVDVGGSEPLHRQVYASVRRARCARIPSSRELALSLGVSRSTVIGSYEQPIAEGCQGRHGSGTYVTTEPGHTLAPARAAAGWTSRGAGKPVRLSDYANALRDPVDPRAPALPLRYRFNRLRSLDGRQYVSIAAGHSIFTFGLRDK